jgi:membrane protein implicated in regulation of membrane protease activity
VSIFAALDGISPWWWVAAAILLAALEMLTVSTVLIWSALAAIVTALWLFAVPGLPGTWQLACFGLLSIAFTFAGRALVSRLGFGDDKDGAGQLNRRAAQLVGRDAVVVSFEAREGQVTVDGVPWPARLDVGAQTPATGDRVSVVAADGIVVRVRPV